MRSLKMFLTSAEISSENATSLVSDGGLDEADGAGAAEVIGIGEMVYEEEADESDGVMEMPADGMAEDSVLSWVCCTGNSPFDKGFLLKRTAAPIRIRSTINTPKIFDCGMKLLYIRREVLAICPAPALGQVGGIVMCQVLIRTRPKIYVAPIEPRVNRKVVVSVCVVRGFIIPLSRHPRIRAAVVVVVVVVVIVIRHRRHFRVVRRGRR